ncbi:MAG: hypothetical protein H7Z12_19705 [Rhodospirillaceae bacterium]|nr:hypothetical protein [Rhodospirillales bacterium]
MGGLRVIGLSVAVLVGLAACTTTNTNPPKATAPATSMAKPAAQGLSFTVGDNYKARCRDLRVEQDGKDIEAKDGTFRVAKRPFTLIYAGKGSAPAISLARSWALNAMIANTEEPEMWGSAGDYMAHDETDLPQYSTAKIYNKVTGYDGFAKPLGANYGVFLQQEAAKPGRPSIAMSIRKAAGGFDKQGDRHVQTVRSIDGVPLADWPHSPMHLTYFATLERHGPAGPGGVAGDSLVRMNWGTCVLEFR